jgi:hypothetical protein
LPEGLAAQLSQLRALDDQLCLQGDLRHLLNQTQRTFWDKYWSISDRKTLVLEVSRQVGKSYFLAVLSASVCLRAPDQRVVFVAKTIAQAYDICRDVFGSVALRLPPAVRPELVGMEWRFPNGSRTKIFGAEDERSIDRGRGVRNHLVLVDEASFNLFLGRILTTLNPTLKTTRGRTVVSSSSGKPNDQFFDIARAARLEGRYCWADWTAPTHVPRADVEELIRKEASDRGMSLDEYQRTADFRREYLSVPSSDDDLGIYPQFDASKHVPAAVPVPPRHAEWYAGVDPGMRDRTAVVACYWDHERKKLVVSHERLLHRGPADIAEVDDALSEIEALARAKFRRVVVDDPHGFWVSNLWAVRRRRAQRADKHGRDAWEENLRRRFRLGQVEVSPGCPELARQLQNAVRKSAGGEMARTDRDGHFDLTDALLYMNRHLDVLRDPVPPAAPGEGQVRPEIERPGLLTYVGGPRADRARRSKI